MRLFGSRLRGDARPDSDVDLLVEFESGRKVGFFQLSNAQDDLSRTLAQQVDLRTPNELSRYFRDQVLGHSVIVKAKNGRQ